MQIYFNKKHWDALLAHALTTGIQLPLKNKSAPIPGFRLIFNPFCEYAARVHSGGVVDIRKVWPSNEYAILKPVCQFCPALVDNPNLCLGGLMADYRYARKHNKADAINPRLVETIKKLQTLKLKGHVRCTHTI